MKAEIVRNKSTHPCFDFEARHQYARVHLPVAAKCNIKCKFCDRRYSCLNENRPGVSTEVLSPRQALAYFDALTERLVNISVVGIAGPGDAFATPGKTIETLRLIRRKCPSIQFCIATNGFNVWPYIGMLKNIGVTHMTVTVNAVDLEIGEKIYAWAREGRKIYRGREAAEILIERQLAVVEALGKEGIAVKVNTVLIPGVNDEHVVDVAKKAGSLGAYTFNAMPLYPLAGTEFEDVESPAAEALSAIREQCGKYLRQMTHCRRCRADAVGMLNEPMSEELKNCLRRFASGPLDPFLEDKQYIAAATTDNFFVDQHLGAAREMSIYKETKNSFEFVERRKMPDPGCGDDRWKNMAEILKDCKAVFVNRVGGKPKKVLQNNGIKVYEEQCSLIQAFYRVFKGKTVSDPQGYIPEAYLSEKDCGSGGCSPGNPPGSCSTRGNSQFCG